MLLGGVLFTFVLFMRDLGPLLELVVRNSASPSQVAELFLLAIPDTLTVTLPMAVLVGILLGLSRMSADSEITAMRTAGIGVFRFVRIVAILAVATWLLGLFNSLYLAPKSAAALMRLENTLKDSQAAFEVEPRVFYEDFRNYVLYTQDSRPGEQGAIWHHVFLADVTQPANPLITMANQAAVVSGPNQTLQMRLLDGSQHQTFPEDPNQYSLTTFAQMDLPLQTGSTEDTHIGHLDSPLMAMGNRQLYLLSHLPGGLIYKIELQRRFSYPAACLVLMLIGVPLGLTSKRGGKSTGFVLTILLVFIYYFLYLIGNSLAKQSKVPVFVGVWMANAIFAAAGIFLLWQLSRGGLALDFFARIGSTINAKLHAWLPKKDSNHLGHIVWRPRRVLKSRFPLLLDDYVMTEFLKNFALVLLAFIMLNTVFNFFELLSDIVRNRTPLVTVGEYLLNLIPYMLDSLLPLCVLVAVLITLGIMHRNSELTAMKATGISLYRVITPVIVIAAMLAAALFFFDETYLPAANRRQEALRSIIKGRPPETFLRPDRKWIFGQQENNYPERIFYYRFFDRDHDVFDDLTVFEFQPDTFQLSRRIFADSARWDTQLDKWVLENGWERTFAADTTTSYQTFDIRTFGEIHELPAYFTKEDRPSQEMSYDELSHYIDDLSQSGFDTIPLRVQLYRKLAEPLITLVMAVLAVPFALSMGKRGSLTGVAVAIGVAVTYWVISGLFVDMGNVNTLPAIVAAWSPDLLFALTGGYLLLRTPT
jgi:LPS export ABC transporter permease LptG/LPS export ABC transporter permease LptF